MFQCVGAYLSSDSSQFMNEDQHDTNGYNKSLYLLCNFYLAHIQGWWWHMPLKFDY